MTIQETKTLLTAISSYYPTFKPNNVQDTLKVWAVALEPYDYEMISTALITRVRTNESAFAPSTGELIAIANRLIDNDELDENAIMSEIRKAVKNGNYGAEDEFNNLSHAAKLIVRTPSTIRQWAQLESNDFETVIGSFIKKSVPTVTRQIQENKSIDSRQAAIIARVTEKLTQAARQTDMLTD